MRERSPEWKFHKHIKNQEKKMNILRKGKRGQTCVMHLSKSGFAQHITSAPGLVLREKNALIFALKKKGQRKF